ncbi:hypothetical protein KIS1582_4417 [Cytobacillus firmus]|uniref:Uncharacterized protein n=1 Tax=Cytobacillus firmus TaxID=1399 RepID=A0A800MSU1_CYTFI|nr:hypothetical protein KIS1582_4417 [Cytobacillus firmus]
MRHVCCRTARAGGLRHLILKVQCFLPNKKCLHSFSKEYRHMK